MEKQWLYGKTLDQLTQIVIELGMPRFTGKQIAVWLYKKGATAIDQMSDISQKNRETLSQNYCVGLIAPTVVSQSSDGTKKYLFPTLGGGSIESAYIPDRERSTLCVSCQAGCKMGCEFCMTGKQGFAHNLSAGEILNQMASLPEQQGLTNLVYMGMGEPMDNIDAVLTSLEIMTAQWGYAWSPTRITVSTIGLLPALRRFMDESSAHLAVSLHNPVPSQRAEIVPLESLHPIATTVALLKEYDLSHQRRVSFEYIVMEGLNDSALHIRELCRLLNGLKCRINLIRFHRIPDSRFVSPPDSRMTWFRDQLTAKGIITTIRSSRGEDIQAACGLLSTSASKG